MMTRFLSLQWEELKAARPVEGEEDPELLEEIAEARKNLGQFTRKTSPEYEPGMLFSSVVRFWGIDRKFHKSLCIL